MNLPEQLAKVSDYVWTNDRFAANVTAIGIGLFLVLVSWLIVQSILSASRRAILSLKFQDWAYQTTERIHCLLQVWLWRLFVALSCSFVSLGCAYHVIGGDVGSDLHSAIQNLTRDRIWMLGQSAFFLLAVALVTWGLLRTVRSLRPVAEAWTLHRIRNTGIYAIHGESGHRTSLIPGGVLLIDRYLQTAIILVAFLISGNILEIASITTPPLGFLLRVITILVIARMLTLIFRAFSGPLMVIGDRRFRLTRFAHYWERLGRLMPLGERCFEMAIWIAATGMCIQQLDFIRFVSDYGEKLVQCIGIFFGTRVFIEFLQVLLHEFFGLYRDAPTTSQQARTLVPLLFSVGQYMAYFGAAVAMLKVFGFPTEPILAGAGVIGLAVGLGAQSLVTDVVSGLFILFENQYLVGDFVEIGHAKGFVEAVAVRHTQVRDDSGKLHIIPNGQIKEVVNYSKGFIHATVDVVIPSNSDVEAYISAIQEAGTRLKSEFVEVLSETVVQGFVSLSVSEIIVRAVTPVRPGSHVRMENEFRRILKSVLDENQIQPAARRAA